MGADLPEELPNWPSMFVALFDRVFTEKHLSWRCFRRSSVASVATVLVIFLTIRIRATVNILLRPQSYCLDMLEYQPVMQQDILLWNIVI